MVNKTNEINLYTTTLSSNNKIAHSQIQQKFQQITTSEPIEQNGTTGAGTPSNSSSIYLLNAAAAAVAANEAFSNITNIQQQKPNNTSDSSSSTSLVIHESTQVE